MRNVSYRFLDPQLLALFLESCTTLRNYSLGGRSGSLGVGGDEGRWPGGLQPDPTSFSIFAIWLLICEKAAATTQAYRQAHC